MRIGQPYDLKQLANEYQDTPDASNLKFSESSFVLPPKSAKTVKNVSGIPGGQRLQRQEIYVRHPRCGFRRKGNRRSIIEAICDHQVIRML